MNENFNKCSIIIPTYNRPVRLRRLLDYYNKYSKGFNIIVADSSSNKNKKVNKRNVLLFSNINITYLSYPINIKPYYYAKIAKALDHVNTKYVVVCGDDDFIIATGINQSLDFLEKNQDFTAAHGQYISFYFKTNKMGKKRLFWQLISHPYKSISFVNAKERLFFHLSFYCDTLYAVHRTDLLKMTFKETIKFTDDDRFGELLPSMLDSVYGKIKELDCLYCVREAISNSTGRTSKNIFDFIKNGTYEKKYTKFRECLAKALVSEEDISKEKAQKLIDNAMNKYLGSSMFKLKLKAGLKRIVEHNALLKKFYLVYRQFKTSKKEISVLDRLPPIEYDNQENLYYEDFIRIKEAVEGHYKIDE